jgi:hypothetical protein
LLGSVALVVVGLTVTLDSLLSLPLHGVAYRSAHIFGMVKDVITRVCQPAVLFTFQSNNYIYIIRYAAKAVNRKSVKNVAFFLSLVFIYTYKRPKTPQKYRQSFVEIDL